jgi:hypothetical protein
VTPITEADVRNLVTRWFDAVRLKLPIEKQRRFFAPGVKIETWAGVTLPLESQIAIHDRLTDEDHILHWLKLEPLAAGRVHATADMRWEATKITDRPGEKRIRADCGEDWIIERGTDGQLRFARYLTSSMRYLPGSAAVDLD